MKYLNMVLILFGVTGLLSGCSDEGKAFRDQTVRAGKYNAEGDLEVQNERALQMEADLSRRHRFYQALKGTYDGDLKTTQGLFKIRMTLVPSLPPYPVDAKRIRTIEEVTADLTGLYFNAQIVQWEQTNPLSSVGCRIEGIRPDMTRGEIFIASENCPNFYGLLLSDGVITIDTSEAGVLQEEQTAVDIAAALIEGKITRISQLRGKVRPTTHAATYDFLVDRTAQ